MISAQGIVGRKDIQPSPNTHAHTAASHAIFAAFLKQY